MSCSFTCPKSNKILPYYYTKKNEQDALKNEVNSLRTENDELQSTVARMRYQTLALAEDMAATDQPISVEIRERLNELAVENSDLKEQVGKMRYLGHPGNEDGAGGE